MELTRVDKDSVEEKCREHQEKEDANSLIALFNLDHGLSQVTTWQNKSWLLQEIGKLIFCVSVVNQFKKVNWLQATLLSCVSVRSLDQKLLNGSRIWESGRVAHSQMQRCVAQKVLGVDIDSPRLQIVACCVRTGTAGPMQGSRLLFVFGANRKTLLLEIRQTESLITLCRHVKHIDAFVCFHVEVCTVTHEQLDQLDVSMEACEMKRVEALLGL